MIYGTTLLNKANYTHDVLLRTMKCNISVISEAAEFKLFQHFGFQSGRDVNKLAGFTGCGFAKNEIPYIKMGTNAYFSVNIRQVIDLGSHSLFIGDASDMKVLKDTPSATYSYYQEHIKPKPAMSENSEKETIWRCRVCGYEYIGDELPEGFLCPLCKHSVEDFEKIG